VNLSVFQRKFAMFYRKTVWLVHKLLKTANLRHLLFALEPITPILYCYKVEIINIHAYAPIGHVFTLIKGENTNFYRKGH